MRIGTPEFTTWMRAKPRPDRVKAYLDSGAPRTVKVRPRKGVRYWKEVTDALSAYEVMRVELLDEAGNVLRTMTVEAEEEVEDRNAERTERQAKGTRPDELVAPADLVASSSSRRETRLVEFARLLKEAYTTGASLQSEASKHAFDKLVALTETAFQRLDQLERAYNRVFRQRIKHDLAEGEEEEDEASKAIKGMVAQRFLGVGAVAPNGNANGGAIDDFKSQLKDLVAEVIVDMNKEGGD